MSPTLLIVVAVTYLIGMPILLRLICQLQKKLIVDKKLEKAGKSRDALKKVPPPIWPKVKERLRFTIKDTRQTQLGKKTLGVENRITFLILYGVGAVLFIGAAAIGMWSLLPIGVILFFAAVIFSYKSTKQLLETRQNILKRMYDIGRAKMGLSGEYEQNPGEVIKILEWEDYIKPKQVEYAIPTNFGQESVEGFLTLFNLNFGGETAWVPSDKVETTFFDENENEISESDANKLKAEGGKVKEKTVILPGWNFTESIVTLHAVPPLPESAPWSEHYVRNENIAWSFFPIALGVENGVELVNAETGETENVLGFDLSGEQRSIANKTGVRVATRIVTSPMVFIGGGTGGGKALAEDTPVKLIEKVH